MLERAILELGTKVFNQMNKDSENSVSRVKILPFGIEKINSEEGDDFSNYSAKLKFENVFGMFANIKICGSGWSNDVGLAGINTVVVESSYPMRKTVIEEYIKNCGYKVK